MPEKAIDIFRRFATAGCLKVFSIVNVKWSMHNLNQVHFVKFIYAVGIPMGQPRGFLCKRTHPVKA
jgi:hypothetical protein